jgi:hypothetical protein
MKTHIRRLVLVGVSLLALVAGNTLTASMASAADWTTPKAYTQSQNAVIIGGVDIVSGGLLNITDTSLSSIAFTEMTAAGEVTAASLLPYDTAVLNMAGTLSCSSDSLSPQSKTDLVNFVADGKKLIIYDSECQTIDYSWLPYPFTTSNPGGLGAHGTLTIDENNTLSSNVPSSSYFIDTAHLSNDTDAVGDMNVMTTLNANWKRDMSGTNANSANGPVHTYAEYPATGSTHGLMIYNGLDQDYSMYGEGDPELFKIWKFELLQPFNPSGLAGSVGVVPNSGMVSGSGITQNGKASFDLYAKALTGGLLQARLTVWAPGTAFFHGGILYGKTFDSLSVSGNSLNGSGNSLSNGGSGNTATLTGSGTWNGRQGYTFTIVAVDDNRRSLTSTLMLRTRDAITITIWDPSHVQVFTTTSELKSGGIDVQLPLT